MDKMLYIAASGAKQNLLAIAVKGNNLANAKTTGFKADFEQARSMQAFGEGLPTRVFAMEERPGSSMVTGAISTTGRDLDVALTDDNWMAVMDAEGNEAYTRSGNLHITATGELKNREGHAIMGDVGPIVLPVPLEKIQISEDGTIQVRPQGAPANFLEEIDRIKVVNAFGGDIEKGLDGLFRPKPHMTVDEFDASPTAKLVTGALEMSNVNPVDEMVGMIHHQRQFELQVKMMKTAEENDQRHNQLLRIV